MNGCISLLFTWITKKIRAIRINACTTTGIRTMPRLQAFCQLSGHQCSRYPMPIRAKTFQYPTNSWLANSGWKDVKIWLIMEMEPSKVELRKNIQHRHTKWKVINTAATLRQPVLRYCLGRCNKLRKPLCNAKAAPCSPPHTTKFHEAPCHSPPNSMVNTKLTYVRNLPLRFPPN